MKKPAATNEARRLKVLWQYDVLDTVPEEVFDDLTELAARICEAPIALISLVDEDRQWFKSKVGVTVSETSRDISFCAHAVKQQDLFIIPDATKDLRFANNPLVTSEPKIRFYAGAPLITPDGHALGTLCVIDKVPRELRPEQQQALRVLARHVMTQLELRRHTRELAEAHQARESTEGELDKVQIENAKLKRELEKLKKGKPAKKSARKR
jgi:GAF domain-containing protein